MATYNAKVFCERISSLMDEAKISIAALHKYTGVPTTSIHRMRTDPQANPSISSLKAIADFFSVSVDQLIGDKALIDRVDTELPAESKLRWTNVPIISWKHAINASKWLEDGYRARKGRFVSTDLAVSVNTYALEVKHTLLDGFRKGAIIICDPDVKPEARDYVICYKIGSDEASLKQLHVHDGEQYLKPLDAKFDLPLLDKNFKILSVVRQIRIDLVESKNK